MVILASEPDDMLNTNQFCLYVFIQLSDIIWYAMDIEDMTDIWYPSIYIGNGLKFKSQDSIGPVPKALDMLW